MNETLKTLEERRSIRSYKERQIPEEILEQILRAGTFAPSGMGGQSAAIAVTQDKDTIRKLSRLNASVMGEDIDPFYNAPTVITVLADKKCATCVEDGSLVMGNLMNAAASLGIGSCWIHRAKEVAASVEGREIVKAWGLDPDKYVGIAHCILGYPAEEAAAAAERKEGYIIRA